MRGSPLFSEAAHHCNQEFAYVKFPWDKISITPVFPGIPPHVLMMAELECLKDEMHLQSLEVVEGIKNELDKRNIGGQAF
eukprot:13848927-Ditylum_brightwellii.AAC.1